MSRDDCGPLASVKVVVLSGMGPVPFCSMLLADMGAHVVRIGRPGGHKGRSNQFDALGDEYDLVNRGIESVHLDLKSTEGLDAALRLIDNADVFVEGYRPEVAARLGLGPADLEARNPRLVYAQLTGYGQSGPMAHSAGHDINYVAQSGALHIMARSGEAPRPPINLLGDYAGGGLLAAFGVVCALLERGKSGCGQTLDAAMVDGVALLTTKLQGLRAAGFYVDEPGTNVLDSGAPYYDTYLCSDGAYMAVGALEPDFYALLLEKLGVDTSEWPEQYDQASWPQLRMNLTAAFASKTQSEWARVFAGSDACVSPVLTFDQAAEDPHNVGRELYTNVAGVQHPSPAPRFSRTPARTPRTPTRDISDVESLIHEWNND